VAQLTEAANRPATAETLPPELLLSLFGLSSTELDVAIERNDLGAFV